MWLLLHPEVTIEHLGFLPYIILAEDPRPVSEQLEERYAHGGGWNPYPKGKWTINKRLSIQYPGDPVLQPLAMIHLKDQTVYFYEHSLICVVDKDGSWDIARVD